LPLGQAVERPVVRSHAPQERPRVRDFEQAEAVLSGDLVGHGPLSAGEEHAGDLPLGAHRAEVAQSSVVDRAILGASITARLGPPCTSWRASGSPR